MNKRRWTASVLKDSRGQILPLAVIVLAVALPLVVVMLTQVDTMLRQGSSEREQRMKIYAAETTINRIIADLTRGADGVPTTYVTTEPHVGGQPYQTFSISTSYSAPSTTLNGYTPAVAISLPAFGQTVPGSQQSYVDPGVIHPGLATVVAGNAYLLRLYNVKQGTLQVNWAYSPAGISRVGVWAGIPTDNMGQTIPPGEISTWPNQHPILDTGSTPANVTSNRTDAISVDPATDGSGGVYTIVLDNSRGQTTKTTQAFAPTGGPDDTWIYVKSYKDYLISASVDGVIVKAYLRQVPGFSEPPAYTAPWSMTNVSFIINNVYVYTWLSP